MEQNQGIKLVSFGDEHSSQQENKHFHPLCLEGGISVKFELVKQIHQKFRIRNHQATHEVSKQYIILLYYKILYM